MQLVRAILFVEDLDRMTAFYRDALGLGPVAGQASSGWVELQGGGASLALHPLPPHNRTPRNPGTPPQARKDSWIKLVFRVPDLEEARARLTAHGAQMKDPWAPGVCDGLDPEGNIIQITDHRWRPN